MTTEYLTREQVSPGIWVKISPKPGSLDAQFIGPFSRREDAANVASMLSKECGFTNVVEFCSHFTVRTLCTQH